MSAWAAPIARARAALLPFARGLESFALPQRCPACAAEAPPERLLCDDCLRAVPRVSYALCARCLVREREPVGCARHPHHVVWPAWVYDERAALAVRALKFEARPGLADALAAPMAAALPPALAPDLVLAVPLHAARRRERGYDQAALLADALAERIGVPRMPDALARVRATPAQSRLGARARRENLAGAFRVRRPAALVGRRVVVVDDVVTTGATLTACLDALAGAGAEPCAVALAWAA